jgi:hydroxymethylbilane synthase
MILAKAGLDRLGYRFTETGTMAFDDSELICHILPPNEFPPAVGQGAVGLEIRETDSVTKELIEAINDKPTFFATMAEREFLRLLDAGCHTPVGVQSTMQGDILLLHAMVFSEASPHDPPRKAAAKGKVDQALLIARELFENLS